MLYNQIDILTIKQTDLLTENIELKKKIEEQINTINKLKKKLKI